MHNIQNIRNHTDLIKKKLEKRNINISIIDEIKEKDEQYLFILKQTEKMQQELNIKSKKVPKLKCDKKKEILKDLEKISDKIKINKQKQKQIKKKIDDLLMNIPNILNDDVPYGKNEKDNKEVFVSNFKSKKSNVKPHWEIGVDLDILDFKTAAKIIGSRFSIFKKDGAKLIRALVNFMIEKHKEAGYQELFLPVIVNENSLLASGNLPKFKDDLYKIENKNFYLIPTSEVTLINTHRDETLKEEDFPIKYTSYSSCFRSEAGSAGKDIKGIIRQHQFEKIEMVNFSKPEQSSDLLEDMKNEARLILEELELPYRVVLLCSGDTGFSSAKTYDIEVWMPSYNDYKEISSCSNCLDFQARRANIRYKDSDKKNKFVHTLNGSGLAIGRTFAAILENHQNEDGTINIPKKLVPYMNGQTKIE